MEEGIKTPLGIEFYPEPASCQWHQDYGIEYTVDPRVCRGPACRAYRDAVADEGVDREDV